MKIKEIVQLEARNRDDNKIWLVRDGIFYRAYEYSAMRFYEKIAPFKISARRYKNEGVTLCYLGFPIKNLQAILQKAKFDPSVFVSVNQNLACLEGFPLETDFDIWKNSQVEKIDIPAQEERELLMHSEKSPKKMSALQLYKSAYDLMVRLHQFVMLISKEHKYTIGERICNASIDMTLEVYRWAHEDKLTGLSNESSHKKAIRSSVDVVRKMLRLLLDLKKISVKSFTSLNEQIEYIWLEVAK
ncbi:MAG: four helix bundle protein [Bacteroidales bacterium]|nr:four helix bundle protein [Bacteroidales bacterium]